MEPEKNRDLLPATVEGVNGAENINEKFRNEYKELYNQHHDPEGLEKISKELEEEIEEDLLFEVRKIDLNILKAAISKLKPGKGDVTGSYT